MLFRPPPPFSRRLWDAWILPWNGAYHLMHLEHHNAMPPHQLAGIGHAISTDLVHWQRLDTIHIEPVPDSWESRIGLTGALVHHAGQFWMFYGAEHGGIERIGAVVSDDLERWEKHPTNPLIEAASPYHATPNDAIPELGNVFWRDPKIYWRDDLQCYEGLIGARLPEVDHRRSGICIGVVRSTDLVEWSHHAPIADFSNYLSVADCPDIFEINGTWYLTFNTDSSCGRRLDTPTRSRTGGSFYMIGNTRDGPFEFPEDPSLLGFSNNRSAPTVLFHIPGYTDNKKKVVFHHFGGAYEPGGDPDRPIMPSLALPKYVTQNRDRTLNLTFHPAATQLESRSLLSSFDVPNSDHRFKVTGKWANNKNDFYGHSETVLSSVLTKVSAADIHLSCMVQLETAERCGLLLRMQQDKESTLKCPGTDASPTSMGLCVMLDQENNEVTLNSLKVGRYNTLVPRMMDSRRWDFRKATFVRVVARAEFIEVYVNDALALCTSQSENLQAGPVGCFVEAGQSTFQDFRLAELTALDQGWQ